MPDSDHDLFAEGEPVHMECLGLELDYSTEQFGTPIEVLVVAKVLHEGEFAYRLVSTKELNSVEAMGMLRWGQILLEAGILERWSDDTPEEDKL